jgi:hypothetical protein
MVLPQRNALAITQYENVGAEGGQISEPSVNLGQREWNCGGQEEEGFGISNLCAPPAFVLHQLREGERKSLSSLEGFTGMGNSSMAVLSLVNFRLACHPPGIDAKCGDQFLQADFSVLIRQCPFGLLPGQSSVLLG